MARLIHWIELIVDKFKKSRNEQARKHTTGSKNDKKRADKKAVQTLKKQKNIDPDKMTDEEKESMKKEVQRSKSISIMMKYSDLFTTQEINDMANRIQAEQRLKDLNASKVQKGFDFIKKQSNNLNTIVTAYDNVKKANAMYNELKDLASKKKKTAESAKS